MRIELIGAALLLLVGRNATAEVSVADRQTTYRQIVALGDDPPSDSDMQRRINYRLCSERPGCAEGCKKAFEFCAEEGADPAMRARLVAECASDYRKRRDKGEKFLPTSGSTTTWSGSSTRSGPA